MTFSDLLSFNEFIARDALSLIWALGAAFITLVGVTAFFGGFLWGDGIGTGVLAGALILTVGNIAWRILCETLAVVFRINDSLMSIDRKIKEG